MTIKPIETRYKEFLFRSRIEARYAIFLDCMGFVWEYEAEGYNLDGILYLPDFWLPDVRMFAEVKPTIEKVEFSKVKALAKNSLRPVLLLVGLPDFRNYDAIQYDTVNKIFETIDYSLVSKFYPERFPGGNYINIQSKSSYGVDYELAVIAAKSARFEHACRHQISEVSN
jgi:hypothetical protein